MTPEQLKASILQYAIQGKLVEQRPEEGTGEELYQQIQKEMVKSKVGNLCPKLQRMRYRLIFLKHGNGLGWGKWQA